MSGRCVSRLLTGAIRIGLGYQTFGMKIEALTSPAHAFRMEPLQIVFWRCQSRPLVQDRPPITAGKERDLPEPPSRLGGRVLLPPLTSEYGVHSTLTPHGS